jgi:alcohol dehydrogenase
MKHAIIGALITGKGYEANIDVSYYSSVLCETLENWTNQLNIERLGKYGITTTDIDNIIERTGLKNNPVHLTSEDIKEIVIKRI